MPKAGGFAFVLEAMEGKFNSILDVTIVYPGGSVSFGEALKGKLKKVIVDVEEIQVPDELKHGSYLEDPIFREKIQTWVRLLWEKKDRKIEALLKEA